MEDRQAGCACIEGEGALMDAFVAAGFAGVGFAAFLMASKVLRDEMRLHARQH